MKENNKINRRTRPRPYDLRRKVLLKNFLREQMKQVPHIQLPMPVENGDKNISEQPSKSFEVDGLQELNDENTSSPSVSAVDSSSSTKNIEDSSRLSNDKNDESNIISSGDSSTKSDDADYPSKESKYFRFTSLMNLRSESRKKKVKGIIKAKKVFKNVKSPIKSKPFKIGLDRLLRSRTSNSTQSSPNKAAKGSSKSLFSLFKSRREQRKVQEVVRTKPATVDTKLISKDESRTSASQSVQTENNGWREEMDRMQHLNVLLREEIRLLSESLSYFRSSNSMNSQMNRFSSPLQYSNINSLRRTPSYDRNLSSSALHGYDNWHSRSRISRSQSVQVHSERRDTYRNNYRTRSMNSHDVQSECSNRSSTSVSSFRSKVHDISIPRVRKKNILASLPVNSTVRVIQRRSSMPERILAENDRSRMCRRSGGGISNTRMPFHSLPSEAFY